MHKETEGEKARLINVPGSSEAGEKGRESTAVHRVRVGELAEAESKRPREARPARFFLSAW